MQFAEDSMSTVLCLLLVQVLMALGEPGEAFDVIEHTEAIFLPQPLTSQTDAKLHGDVWVLRNDWVLVYFFKAQLGLLSTKQE